MAVTTKREKWEGTAPLGLLHYPTSDYTLSPTPSQGDKFSSLEKLSPRSSREMALRHRRLE